MEKLTEQEQIRRQKMEELRERGIDPFGHAYDIVPEISAGNSGNAAKKSWKKKM